MRLNDVIQKAYKKNWTLTSNFNVKILQSMDSVFKDLAFMKMADEINMHIVNVSLPDITGHSLENWQVDRYRIQIGNDQTYRFTIDFIDHNNLELWRSFLDAYMLSRDNYFDVCKLEILIYKEDDYEPDANSIPLIGFSECMIESVGKVSLSNENVEMSKFIISFKAQKFHINGEKT